MVQSSILSPIKFPLLLDGGLSNQLEAQGCDLNHPLWTAKLLLENPEALINCHLAYLEAGARCFATASYQASIPGFVNMGKSIEDAEYLIALTVELAVRARELFMEKRPKAPKPLIAASIGPYGAYLADGAEYKGNYGVSKEELQGFHQRKIEILEASEADILAFETFPDFQEVQVIGELLTTYKKPAWLSFSCKNDQYLHDGTLLKVCGEHFRNHPTIFALGANCIAPTYIPSIIKTLKAACPEKRIIVYPNLGETYDANSKTWGEVPEQLSFASQAKVWQELGADIIGGCCRVGPGQIAEMREAFVHT